MSKHMKKGISHKRDANGNRIGKKSMSHGTLRAKRKPNSKLVRNGSLK